MNTCPKCGSQAMTPESYQNESRRLHFRCDSYGYNDKENFDLVYRSELCLEREEKKTLQRKVEALKIDLYFANEAVDQRERSRKETETELRDVKAAGDYWHSKWKEACENARIKHKQVCELKRERNRLIDELQSSTKRETLYAFNEASCKTVAHFAVDENGKHPIDLSVEPITKDKPDWAVKEGYWYEQYQLMRERYHKQIGENSKQAERSRQLEEQLQAKLDDLQASTIHSCGDSCSRPMCVLRREKDAYKESLKYIHSICEDKTISLHPDDDAKATIDECIMEAERAMQKCKKMEGEAK
jgi:hypothetical protein